ncbi:uncharacterized protein K444DRAFT_333363 [Hyaloscypha bicolor E]|uniref:Uncharacterized protein n=1 Tax=Hyaloscypha bicolor E TaxID=1095630 RepID=A0A2J6TK09_9HELO|nr:uncharacterized protein K444DRAFT_333363 [Hyaloscypha bicolor E]PMD63342.1 hypothetical protein K444DRAFT_333363 [Hyaloscypha bicolor E]
MRQSDRKTASGLGALSDAESRLFVSFRLHDLCLPFPSLPFPTGAQILGACTWHSGGHRAIVLEGHRGGIASIPNEGSHVLESGQSDHRCGARWRLPADCTLLRPKVPKAPPSVPSPSTVDGSLPAPLPPGMRRHWHWRGSGVWLWRWRWLWLWQRIPRPCCSRPAPPHHTTRETTSIQPPGRQGSSSSPGILILLRALFRLAAARAQVQLAWR